jgi:MFS family permease
MEASVSRERTGIANRISNWVANSPLRRYPDLGLICLGVFIMLIGVGAIVPVRAIYARDHGATLEEIGLMASAFLLGQFIFQLPGGWASDKWGRKPILIAGVFIGAVVCFMFLLSDHAWWYIGLRFVEGMASGIITPAANAYVIDTVPAKERGAAFGWLGSAFSAGFMLGPAIGGPMSEVLGYAAPFIFGGVTGLLTTGLLMWKMSNLKPGAHPDATEEAAVFAEAQEKQGKKIPSRLFVPGLVAALAFSIAGGLGDGLFISIWTIWLDDLNASTSYIGLTFMVFSLPLMILMPITGRLADRYRLSFLMAIPYAMVSSVYYFYTITTDLFWIATIGLLEGTFLAISIPALSSFIANLSPDKSRGKLQGVFSTTRTISGFVSSIATAILYSHSMTTPFMVLAISQVTLSIFGGLLAFYVEQRARSGAAARAVVKAAA